MSKKYTADGTYGVVKSQTLKPPAFIKLRTDSDGLPVSEILSTVRYVQPTSPDIPKNGINILKAVKIARKAKGMQWLVALWPDKVCTVLCFPSDQPMPRNLQLIRAYRCAREAMLVVEAHDKEINGGKV